MTAPHHLRCETCKNKSHEQPCPALDIVRKQYDREFGINHWWDIAHIVTSIVGCASHSSLQPKDGHCGHECVCGVLMVGGIEGDMSPCNIIGCKHDTRKQPSAEHDSAIRRESYDQGAREERERVLDEVYQKLLSDMNDRSFVDSDGDFIQCIGLSMDEIDDAIKSLRSSK